jgi:hypothetical protein
MAPSNSTKESRWMDRMVAAVCRRLEVSDSVKARIMIRERLLRKRRKIRAAFKDVCKEHGVNINNSHHRAKYHRKVV